MSVEAEKRRKKSLLSCSRLTKKLHLATFEKPIADKTSQNLNERKFVN